MSVYSVYMDANFRKKTIAAIDLGSQTFSLAVVRIVDNRPQVLASELKNVRLGQGLADSCIGCEQQHNI
jgi:exopolyphosphatase/pppGpp-phosphohydrolase